MKLDFPGEVSIKKQQGKKKENGEGEEVRQTRLYIDRASTASLPSKPQTLSCRFVSPFHRGMSSQMGPTSAGSNKGPPGRLREGGCTQSLRRSIDFHSIYWSN